MDLLSLALSLSLPMSGGEFTGDYSFNVDPTLGLQSSIVGENNAVTLPGMVIHEEEDFARNKEFLQHELSHREQQAALGPAFYPAYAATVGRGFEPYDPVARFAPGGDFHNSHDMNQTWMPPDDMKNKFPLFRVQRQGNQTKIQFLPGYPGMNFEVER